MRRAVLAVPLLGVCFVLTCAAFSFADAGNRFTSTAVCRVPAPRPAGALPVGKAPQVHYDARAHATFATRFTAEGTAVVIGTAGELAFEKEVSVDGKYRVTLKAGDDAVTIQGTTDAITVTRAGRAARMDGSSATDEEFLAAKQVLAGSRAVRLHRILAANLDEETLRVPAGLDALITDAVIAFLDGDPAAAERIAERIARKRGALMRASLVRLGCYEEYEAEVIRAWNDFGACKNSFSLFNPLREACTVRYIVWVESAWFHFLSCTALPLVNG